MGDIVWMELAAGEGGRHVPLLENVSEFFAEFTAVEEEGETFGGGVSGVGIIEGILGATAGIAKVFVNASSPPSSSPVSMKDLPTELKLNSTKLLRFLGCVVLENAECVLDDGG